MDVRLIEAASEIGAGKRGASMGMSALRVAAWKNGSDLFGHAEESILRDENDVLYEDDSSPNAHHIDGLIRFDSFICGHGLLTKRATRRLLCANLVDMDANWRL